jgi:hypothetical protein
MKNHIKTRLQKPLVVGTLAALAAITTDTQAAIIYTPIYDTTFGEGAGNVLSKADNQAVRDDLLWQAASASSWTHGPGNSWIYNQATGSPSGNDGASAEGPLFKILDLSGAGLTNEHMLNLSFNYSAWGAEAGSGVDDLYIHVWGFVDVNSTATTEVANLNSQEGNSWGSLTPSEYDDFTRYNLKDGSVLAEGASSNAGSRAITMDNISLSLTNDGTQANADFLLTSTGTLANYDYLAVSFTRNVADDSGESFAIRDFTLAAAVPEPSSTALLGLGGLALMLRRKRS